MFEWLDGLSLWWYIAGTVFVLVIMWLAYIFYHVPLMEDDETIFKKRILWTLLKKSLFWNQIFKRVLAPILSSYAYNFQEGVKQKNSQTKFGQSESNRYETQSFIISRFTCISSIATITAAKPVIKADTADFSWRTKLGSFNGNVHITQDDRTWSADSVTYNFKTKILQ